MKTKYRETSEGPLVLQIPQFIKEDIEDRGFHLYNWIDPEEVRLSVERDFLKILKYT